MARKTWKGPFVDLSLLAKAEVAKDSGRTGTIKTWSRRSTILPTFVGLTFNVYNGRKFVPVSISEEMVGARLGDFAPTRYFPGHAAADSKTPRNAAKQSLSGKASASTPTTVSTRGSAKGLASVPRSQQEAGKAVQLSVVGKVGRRAGRGSETADDDEVQPLESAYSGVDASEKLELLEAAAAAAAADEGLVERTRVARILELDPANALVGTEEDLIDVIARGFPPSVLHALRAAGWTYAAMELVIAPRRTLMRRKAGNTPLTPSESDAAWRMASALSCAETVFSSRAAAHEWLHRPKPVLRGRAPTELLQSGVGYAHVLSLLRKIDSGDLA